MAERVEQTKEFFESIKFQEKIENEVGGETKEGYLARLVVKERVVPATSFPKGPPANSPTSTPKHHSDEPETKA